ncbi:cation diffusion facilitator family transporter [Holdemanella biformis]|jgi:cation diffusion facilitator family transporter|uniref:cation diffusion facilitator family transporter n=1 Tax=Holdemanella biformis TaxID=1735 RepID=UPI001C271FEC|nr:cation diffusion facilitator family transporter [Holdemanella biformis]MBU9896114.1 cation diffusion facilitator family transporter [Holdemanella biformis]MBV3417207.1 cation diffusion facilitator family transporter [Holdemanella biformis]
MDFLVRRFIKNYQDTKDANVRTSVGKLSGIVGILNNLFLFVIKFLIGTIVHSVSIQADGVNNLTDAGSNIISILSFHLSNKPADKDHPFGHERTETIASLFVGILILVLGFETAKESISKVIHPGSIDFRLASVIILLVSIIVKFWMYTYNKKLSKTYDSSLLEATALDSISDVCGTTAVLVSTLLSPVLHFNLDGYMGIVVSGIILYGAYGLLRDMINSLIGEAPDPELVHNIVDMIMAHPAIIGVHDMMLHNYGPNKIFASAHVEVDSSKDIFETHDHIDNIEREVKENMNIDLVLHMDPVKVNDPETELYRAKVVEAIHQIDPKWGFHDFRIVSGPTHVNLVFDLVIPFEEKYTQEEIEAMLLKYIQSDKKIYLVLTIDHPYA